MGEGFTGWAAWVMNRLASTGTHSRVQRADDESLHDQSVYKCTKVVLPPLGSGDPPPYPPPEGLPVDALYPSTPPVSSAETSCLNSAAVQHDDDDDGGAA